MNNLRSILIVFLMSTICVSAQKSSLKPLSDFFQVYKDKYDVISKEIENTDNITFNQKLALYESKIGKLKEEFMTIRKSEYQDKRITAGKRHSCTGTRTRSITTCEPVYIKAPNDKMYTKKEWVKLKEIDDDIEVVADSSSAGLKISVSGKKQKKATFFATFKYKPKLIPTIVYKEMVELFDQIVVEKQQ